jgi:DNA topoisomerase IA
MILWLLFYPNQIQNFLNRLYDYIARNFLASISSDAQIKNLTVSFKIGSYDFFLKGSTVINPGFTEIMPWVKLAEY